MTVAEGVLGGSGPTCPLRDLASLDEEVGVLARCGVVDVVFAGDADVNTVLVVLLPCFPLPAGSPEVPFVDVTELFLSFPVVLASKEDLTGDCKGDDVLEEGLCVRRVFASIGVSLLLESILSVAADGGS